MLLLVPILVVIAGAICLWFGKQSTKYEDVREVIGAILLILGGGALATVAFVWFLSYTISSSDIGRMKGTAASISVICDTIERALQVDIAGETGGIVDLTYKDQAGKYTETAKELRDKVLWYNETLGMLKTDRSSPIFGFMFRDPGGLDYLRGDCP